MANFFRPELVRVLPEIEARITSLGFLPDGHTLVSLSKGGIATFWDMRSILTGSERYSIKLWQSLLHQRRGLI
jgi:WD40 repeat protein